MFMKHNLKRIASIILVMTMIVTLVAPSSAMGFDDLTTVIDMTEHEGSGSDDTSAPPASSGDNSPSGEDDFDGSDDSSEWLEDENEASESASQAATPTQAESDTPLGFSSEYTEEEMQAYMAGKLNSLSVAGTNSRARSSSGTVDWTSISIRSYYVTVSPGVDAWGDVMYKMSINGVDAFCTQVWRKVGSGTYYAGEETSGNSTTAKYIANYMASSMGTAEYVATQVLVWESLYGDIGLYSQIIQGTSYQSAYSAIKSGNEAGVGLLFWISGAIDQEIVTPVPTDTPPDPPDPADPPEPDDPAYRIETNEETTTRVDIVEEYEYSDAIGQIQIAKRDEKGASLDGAIFDILVEFKNGDTLRESAFEVYNGTRLFKYTHPADDHYPARVTVREVRAPDGYEITMGEQYADVHPTYTRITKVTTATITITTTTTVVTEIESGEVVSTSSATAETSTNPEIVKEYADFIEGDRDFVLTFVNHPKPATLEIYKYEEGSHSTALRGAVFHVRYDDRDEGDPWEGTFTSGADGMIVIELPRAGMVHITETKPADGGYVFGEQLTWTRYVGRGETVRLEVGNPKRAQLIVRKKDAQSDTYLEGAVFQVELIRALYPPYERALKYEARSDSRGVATFTELIPGDWKLTELIPPSNFLPAAEDAHRIITVEDGNKPTVEVVWENEPYKGVRIRKVSFSSGEGLKNATFSLWEGTHDNKIKHVGEKQSDSNGYVVFTNLPSNRNYVIFEESPPEDHLLDEKPWREFYLDSSVEEVNLEFIFKNKEKPKILVEKVDEDGRPLANAQFTVAHEASKMAFTGTTGADGTYLFEGLSEDWWRISEDFAPPGYIQTVEYEDRLLEAGKTTVVRFVNYKQPRVLIRKIDASNSSIGIAGAVIRVWREGSPDDYTDYITTHDGYIVLEGYSEETIFVQEQTPPPGYQRNEEIFRLQLEKGGKYDLIIPNHKLPEFTINKRNEFNLNEGIPDVTFRFEYQDGIDSFEATTDARGNLTVTLKPGHWTYQEISAPSKWIINSEPVRFQIGQGEDKTELVTNRLKAILRILKRDSVTLQPMGNVHFTIHYKNGGPLGTGEFITDEENGEILIEDIQPGTLIITEIEYEGYISLTPEKEIIIEAGNGEPIEVLFENQPKNPIIIYKKDVDENPVPNTEFLVQKVSGEIVGYYKSGPRGIAIIPNQEPGYYLITETRVGSDEYILDKEPRLVRLERNKPVTLEFINHRKPTLEIVKKIKGGVNDGQTLANVLIRVERMDGSLIGDYRTDSQGRISIQTDPGWVVCYELEPLPGFTQNSEKFKRELKADGSETIEIYNTPLPGFQLQKLCSVNQTPMESVEFRITRLNGSAVGTGTYRTNEQGIIYLDVDEEYLVVTEVKTKEGYRLDTQPRTIGPLIPGDLWIERWENTPYPILELTKLDADTKQPLSSFKFKLFDQYMREIGTYQTNQLGKITLTGMSEGKFYLQEFSVNGPYVLDKTVHEISLSYGKTTPITLYNSKLASFRFKKVCSVSGKALSGAKFLLYDAKNNILGEYTSNSSGIVEVLDVLEPQKLKLKEIVAPDQYVLSNEIFEFEIKSGECYEFVLKNEPIRGQIQITKKAAEKNSLTGDKKGALLDGAVFEILNNCKEVVDTIETEKGIATSEPLPLGVYGIREVTSPKHYLLPDDKMFYCEIKVHNDLIQFEVLNQPEEIETSVEKRGPVEVMGGTSIIYDIFNIQNLSNTDLEDFYIRDVLPIDAVRLEKIFTGTYSERAKMSVYIKTNLKSSYRRIESGLLSTVNNEIDCSQKALKLAANEYVTEFKIEFDSVPAEFKSVEDVKVQVYVLEGLANNYQFTNKVDVGGRVGKEWTYSKDGWTVTVFSKPKGDLPKTGI